MSTKYFFLLLVFFFVIEFGPTERIYFKISLSDLDGYKVATLFIGNTTFKTIKNFSLELDLDTIIDESNRLRGAQGVIRDIKANDIFELTSCDISKEEEIKRALFLCPEKGEEHLHVVSKAEWGSKEEVVRQKRTEAAELLITDFISYKYDSSDYEKYLKFQGTHQRKYFSDLFCNFWISEDGKVFEGIGMDYFNDVFNGGLGPKSLIIGFIKKETHAQPSAAAISSFLKLVKNAICRKMLSLHYRLVPYYLIYDQYSVSGNTFERNELRQWESYTSNLDFMFPTEGENWFLEIVPRHEWTRVTPKEYSMELPSPIKYVIVMEYGARCFFNCTNNLRILEGKVNAMNENLRFNFLLAEDGKVYEITGWEKTWHKYLQQNKAIQVGFLGHFNSYVPRKPIFFALHALIQHGLSSGKLSPHYKVVTIKAANPNSREIGIALEDEIKKLDNYSNTI